MTDIKEYSSALFLLAKEEGKLEAISDELLALKDLLLENPEYTKLLDTPALKKEDRLALASVFMTLYRSFLETTLSVILIGSL